MRAVNLLPRDLERQRSDGGRAPVLLAGGGIAAVTAAAVVLFMSASGSVSEQRSQLESVEASIARIPAAGQPAVAPGTIAQERTDRVTALAAAMSTRVPVDRLLRELAYVLPEDAWLTGLTASAPTAAAPTGAPAGAAAPATSVPNVTIQGATYSHQSVARVLARLAALPTLSDVRLTASARIEPEAPASDGRGQEEEEGQEAEARGHVHDHRERSVGWLGMKARFAALPPRAVIAIAVGAVLVYALVLWFLLISPKRAEATTLADDVIAAELRLAEARVSSTRPQPAGTQVSDVVRLAKAMPSSADQPGLVLELDRLARSTGVKLGSITPREMLVTPGSPNAIPVVVTAEGSYRQITRFVRRARELVRVRGGDVRATGRLFAAQAVELTESNAKGFPLLDATITFNAFVYDGPIVAVDSASERGDRRHVEWDVSRERNTVTPEARAARERKQKIFVVVGGLLLLAMLAFQLPKLLGGSSSPEAAPTTTAATPAATGQPAVTGAAPVALVGSTAAGSGKLTSFSVFAAKDPFVQQVVTENGLDAAPRRRSQERWRLDREGRRIHDEVRDRQDHGRRSHDRHRERRPAGARAGHEVPRRRSAVRSRRREARLEVGGGRDRRRRLLGRREDDDAEGRQADHAREHHDRRPLQDLARLRRQRGLRAEAAPKP